MAERRRETPTAVIQEATAADIPVTVQEWEVLVAKEKREAQEDAARLNELEARELIAALTDSEEDERQRIKNRGESRKVRIEHFAREARVAVEDKNYADFLVEDEDLVAEKIQAWVGYFDGIRHLRSLLDVVRNVHRRQEEGRSALPSYAGAEARFPDDNTLRANAGGRMDLSVSKQSLWKELMTGENPIALPDLAQVLDVDPGCRKVNDTYIQRMKREQAEYRKREWP